MKSEKLLQIIGDINDELIYDAAPKERPEDTKAVNKLVLYWRTHKVAASIIVVLLAVSITFTTTFAASSSFRQAVISIFFLCIRMMKLKKLIMGI